MNPKVSTVVCILIGYLLIDGFKANEQNVIGNRLMLISQLIITNLVSQDLIERRDHSTVMNLNSKEVKSLYKPLEYNIEYLRKILNKIYPEELEDMEC